MTLATRTEYLGRKVAIYRSLVASPETIGCWSEVTQMHVSTCVLLPDEANARDYTGSLVNVVTPFAFLKQAQVEGHTGIIATAGNSATGVAMLGFALAYNVPMISIVRDEEGRRQLKELGAENILSQNEADFEAKLFELAQKFNATAVFDGVGSDLLGRMLPHLAQKSTIYSYGYLGGTDPVYLQTAMLMMKNITLKPFSNFASPTVADRAQLVSALKEISKQIGMPHFKTRVGKVFAYEEIGEAIAYHDKKGGKAYLVNK